MKLSELFESPQEDQHRRRVAEQAYRRVAGIMKRGQLMDYAKQIAPSVILMRGRDIGLSTTVNIIFMDHRVHNIAAAGGVDMQKNALYIFIRDWNQLEREFMRAQGTFVHEFIHIMDGQRGKFKPDAEGNPRTFPPSAEMSTHDYYNSQSEMNAFYQEAIHELDRMIDTARRSPTRWETMKRQVRTFDDLKRHFGYEADNKWQKQMNDRNYRSVMRRLYKYFDEIVKPQLGQR